MNVRLVSALQKGWQLAHEEALLTKNKEWERFMGLLMSSLRLSREELEELGVNYENLDN
jgi:hypothetical protein